MEGSSLKFRIKKRDKGRLYRTIAVAVGVAVNVATAYIVQALNLPMYMDTIGTIGVAALGGMLPGVIVAVISNVICSIFNTHALYYSIINVNIAWYVAALTFTGGFLGIVFQWLLLGGPQFHDIAEGAGMLAQKKEGPLFFIAALFLNLLINLIDKGISAGLAFLVLRLLPNDKKKAIRDSKWHQRPLSNERISKNEAVSGRHALLRKMSLILSVS